jgi:DNA-binding PadR family transcriptional regulator
MDKKLTYHQAKSLIRLARYCEVKKHGHIPNIGSYDIYIWVDLEKLGYAESSVLVPRKKFYWPSRDILIYKITEKGKEWMNSHKAYVAILEGYKVV